MKLLKPTYGQVAAPRDWFLGARERWGQCGLVAHPLVPCLFMGLRQARGTAKHDFHAR